jgi:hypothetical protein
MVGFMIGRFGLICRRAAIALALACFAAALFSRPATALTDPYTMNSDYIMFDIDKKIIYCEGQSEFLFKRIRIQAKTIRVDTKTSVLFAEGEVVMSTTAVSNDVSTTSVESSKSISEESDAQLADQVKSRMGGHQNSYEGDQLKFDLERLAGVLVQTRNEVKKIYVVGETLDEVSEVPQMREGIYLYDEPQIVTNAVTASRFRVSPGDQYEAWHARLWVKGNKVINVPYYTNTSKQTLPGNWRLKNVRYSSNTSWNVGTSIRYKQAKNQQGFFDVTYSADGSRRYTANVQQNFKMGRSTGGVFSMNGILGSGRGYGLSLSRQMGRQTSLSSSISYLTTGSLNYQLSGNTRIGGLRVRGFLHTYQYHATGASNVNALMDIESNTHYIGKSRHVGYQVSSSANLMNNPRSDSQSSMFVAVSAFRSAIEITDRSHMSFSVSTGLGAGTEGTGRSSFGTSVAYGLKTGRSSLVNMTYRTQNSRSDGNSYASQYISTSFSISKSTRWRTTLGTSYDIRKTLFDSLNTTFDYVFSKKCRLWSSMIYDYKLAHFSSKSYNMAYEVYGTTVNTAWYTESNDFSFDFSTNFR